MGRIRSFFIRGMYIRCITFRPSIRPAIVTEATAQSQFEGSVPLCDPVFLYLFINIMCFQLRKALFRFGSLLIYSILIVRPQCLDRNELNYSYLELPNQIQSSKYLLDYFLCPKR